MTASPDASGEGLTGRAADPLRYGAGNRARFESPELIRSMLPSGARVLDVGCGVGAVTAMANEGKNNTVICLEPDRARAQAAMARGLTVQRGALDEAFVAEHGRFDAIVFGDVLEHLADPGAALELAGSALTPGGVIIASVPNVAHWTVRLSLLAGRFDYEDSGIMDATHLRWFTRASLRRLLAQQGLEISDLRYAAGKWLPAYRSYPWRLLPGRSRPALIVALLHLFPTLFACQFVVAARVAAPGAVR